MVQKTYSLEVELPEGVTANVHGNSLIVKGPKGEIKRDIENPRFAMKADAKIVSLALKSGLKQSQRDKMHINSYQSHIKNLINGVIHGYTAKLKVCSGHFPMTVTGLDKEIVGQTAADLEQLTRITNRDRRIFQDGIYITKKPGEE